MPLPKESINLLSNNEYIQQELPANLRELQFKVQEIIPKINRDQKFAYDETIKRIHNNVASKMFFSSMDQVVLGKHFYIVHFLKQCDQMVL